MTVIDRQYAASKLEPESSGEGIRLRAVSKTYGTVSALRGVDLDIAASRFTVLLGPSGSGKTTLLRGIAGIERFDSGSIHFGTQLISEGSHNVTSERRGLSMVFQDYALWPHMTVRQNVAYAIRRRRLGSTDAATQVGDALERVGLEAKAAAFPHELSGGQQQRVALARAIVGDPRLVLFDEPLSNLDADLRERLRVEIATLTRASGATALYITHDQAEAFALADQIGILNQGRIEQLGTPEEIYRAPATPFVAQFTGLAGSFAGIYVGDRDGYSQVRVGDHQLLCTSSTAIAAHLKVDLLIRPTASRLLPLPDQWKRSESANSGDIEATVIDVAYRGRGYDHVVDCAYGRLVSVFDGRAWPRGTRCLLRIDPDGCLAFPSTVYQPSSNSR
jgi:ABC-type Fe3+/spermidine/putrescine transport system ATPase subunit